MRELFARIRHRFRRRQLDAELAFEFRAPGNLCELLEADYAELAELADYAAAQRGHN